MKQVLESVEDIVTVARYVSDALDSYDVWWRGHAREDWKLVPGAHRRQPPEPEREWTLTSRFMQKAPSRHAPCPTDGDLLGWLSLMQHYGLPTRLLDWTESVLVAAYFAVRKHDQHDGRLFALDPFGMNASEVEDDPYLYRGDQGVARSVLVAAFQPVDDQESRRILAITAHEHTLRQMVQLSCFTLHGRPEGIEERPNSKTYLWQFTIPAECKVQMRKDLYALGIRDSNLFPDLERLASDIDALDYKGNTRSFDRQVGVLRGS